MAPDHLRKLLFVRALEESDTDGLVLPASLRESGTAKAMPPEDDSLTSDLNRKLTSEEQRFLVRRADIIAAELDKSHSEFGKIVHMSRWPWWLVLVWVAVATVVGFFSNRLTGDGHINIISLPLIGMLAWSLMVYVFKLVKVLMQHRRQEHVAVWEGWSRILGLHSPLVANDEDPRKSRVIRQSTSRYWTDWKRVSSRFLRARVRLTFHLAAAGLAVGAVAGMYLRGIAYEYLAGWESTFLSVEAVHGLLHFMFTPASQLTGISLPDLAEIAGLRLSAGFDGENAARWIHLYAVTVGLFILIPRLWLAIVSESAARRGLKGVMKWEWKDLYFHRLLQSNRGQGETVEVLPYSFQPDNAQKECLRIMVIDKWGAQARVSFRDTLPYGEEDEYLASLENWSPPSHLILFMNMASTPEAESHGVLVKGMQNLIKERRNPTDLMVVIDASSYRHYHQDESFVQRMTDRLRNWQAMLQPFAMTPAIVHDESITEIPFTAPSEWKP